MLDVVGGLPIHPLVVHATVVLVPLAALSVLLAGVWPAFRRRAGYVPLLLALLALVLVPVTTQSGEAFEERVGGGELVERHAALGEGLLPWVAVLAVVAMALAWMWQRDRRDGARRAPRWMAAVLALAAAAVSVGTVVQTVAVGHSGATAVWGGVANLPVDGGDD